MLGDSININNLCFNPVLKKIGKTSKKFFLGPNLQYKRVSMGHTQN